MEQELASLRRALADKERTLDSIALECQRLADANEDAHAVTEGLRLDLVNQEAALATERRTVAALIQERNQLRARLSGLGLGAGAGVGHEGGHGPTLGRTGAMLPFLAGTWVGIVISLIVGFGYLYLNRPAGPRDDPSAVSVPASPAASGAEQAAATGRAGAR